jgi:alpha-mannosidase
MLRSFGLISRNANPYREDPAGPEIAIPTAQLLGARTFRFALMPHDGEWSTAGTLAAAERYRHPFVIVRGTGPAEAPGTSVTGLRIEGAGVVLSSLRRRGDWLELRVVNESADARTARIHVPLDGARGADLLGRPGDSLAVDADGSALDLGAWEIRTTQLRRAATAGTAGRGGPRSVTRMKC